MTTKRDNLDHIATDNNGNVVQSNDKRRSDKYFGKPEQILARTAIRNVWMLSLTPNGNPPMTNIKYPY